ncbi:hypothetical protein JCM2811A_32560 [Methylorubrum rhodinum]
MPGKRLSAGYVAPGARSAVSFRPPDPRHRGGDLRARSPSPPPSAKVVPDPGFDAGNASKPGVIGAIRHDRAEMAGVNGSR